MTHYEVEAKYSFAPNYMQEVKDQLLTAAQIFDFALSACETKRVDDLYLDTPTLQLAHRQAGLRQRNYAGKQMLTLKMTATPTSQLASRRVEIEGVVTNELINSIYAALNELGVVSTTTLQLPHSTDKILASWGLQPVFLIQKIRTLRFVLHNQQPMAEISMDECTYIKDNQYFNVLDIEVEQKVCGNDAFYDFLQRFEQHFAGKLQREARSKYETGLRLFYPEAFSASGY